MKELARPDELIALVGLRLNSLSRGDLLIDNQPNTLDLGPLELVFDSGATLQIRLASDGESIELRTSPNQPRELLGQGGPWPRVDLSQDPGYRQLLGRALASVDAIYFGTKSCSSEVLAGISFKFESGLSLTYYNAGDCAEIYLNEMPPALTEPFYLRLARMDR